MGLKKLDHDSLDQGPRVLQTPWPPLLREGRRLEFQIVQILDDSVILQALGYKQLGLDWGS